MYKKYYKMVNEMTRYARSNRMYQEILSSKKEQLHNHRRKLRIRTIRFVLGVLFSILLLEFMLILLVNDFDKEIRDYCIVFGSVFLILVPIGNMALDKVNCMEKMSISKLFDKKDMEYINSVLREETTAERFLPFKYKSSHEIIVNCEGNDYVLDFSPFCNADLDLVKVLSFYRLDNNGFSMKMKLIEDVY